VKWGVAGRILWAWVFTIPASALMAVLVYFVSRLVVGLAS
jgi:PiT family inorganic phosphate transporter